MTDENTESVSEESEEKNPWGRIENIVRKVVGEEFSKWEISQSDSQHSAKEEKTEEPSPSSPSSPKPERRRGFLENFFSIPNQAD